MSDIDLAKIVAEDAAQNAAAAPKAEAVPAEPAEQVEEKAEATTAPADEAAEKPEGDEAEGEQPKPKKPGGGFQKRISELTREKHEAQRRAEAAEDRERRLLSLVEGSKGTAAPQPSGDEEPTPDRFNRYEDYTRALSRWEAKQIAKEMIGNFQKQQGEQTRGQAVDKSYQALEAKVLKQAETDPEIGEAFEAAKSGVLPITPAIAEYVREASDDPGALLKYLMNNEDEATRISRLGEVAQVKALAQVEARLSVKPKPKTSSAPPPPARVSGGAAAQQSIERMPYSDIQKWVREQDQRR